MSSSNSGIFKLYYNIKINYIGSIVINIAQDVQLRACLSGGYM